MIPIALIYLRPCAEPHAKSLHDLADRMEVKAAASRTAARVAAFKDRFGFSISTDINAVIAAQRSMR